MKNKSIQSQISCQLQIWAALSMAMGIAFLALRRPFFKGMGVQFVGWGAINGTIGLAGYKLAKKESENNPRIEQNSIGYKSTSKLKNLLRLNAFLDIIYIFVGARLAVTAGKSDHNRLGQGLGILLQGLFLFIFDWYHSLR